MISCYDTRFVKFNYNKKDDILQQTWNYINHRNHLHFYQSINQFLYIIADYKTRRILINFDNFSFCLDIEVQKWVKRNIFARLKTSEVEKIALIKSCEDATQSSLETLFEDGIEKPSTREVVDTIKESKLWLIEQKKNSKPCIQRIAS